MSYSICCIRCEAFVILSSLDRSMDNQREKEAHRTNRVNWDRVYTIIDCVFLVCTVMDVDYHFQVLVRGCVSHSSTPDSLDNRRPRQRGATPRIFGCTNSERTLTNRSGRSSRPLDKDLRAANTETRKQPNRIPRLPLGGGP